VENSTTDRETATKADRWWIPVLAAVVGIVGGVGGAYVGGSVANKGQEQQFENQRAAQVQDLLIDTYRNYLETTSRAWVAVCNDFPNKKQLVSDAFAAESEIVFYTDEIEVVARPLFDAAQHCAPDNDYLRARQKFIEKAGSKIGPVG
jgi:hypothetical protein